MSSNFREHKDYQEPQRLIACRICGIACIKRDIGEFCSMECLRRIHDPLNEELPQIVRQTRRGWE